jgi:uncharacterized protein (TIGR00661 family)
MKIFYAAHATGNGHISRLMELYPYLRRYGQVDVFLSGSNSTLDLGIPVKFRSDGFSMHYTCRGGLHYGKTLSLRSLLRVEKEARSLPVENYDVIINDFESITSLACRRENRKSVHFGHQASFLSPHTPRPEKKNAVGEWILAHYASGSRHMGLHFQQYDTFILPPVIKADIWYASPVDKGHITVYLPSFCDTQLVRMFSRIRQWKFEIFSRQARQVSEFANLRLLPVDKALFNRSPITCHGVICGAGFETPAEALYLDKIIAIPIRGQYEQICNAAALRRLDVTCLDSIHPDFPFVILRWLELPAPLRRIPFRPTREIVEAMFGAAPVNG